MAFYPVYIDNYFTEVIGILVGHQDIRQDLFDVVDLGQRDIAGDLVDYFVVLGLELLQEEDLLLLGLLDLSALDPLVLLDDALPEFHLLHHLVTADPPALLGVSGLEEDVLQTLYGLGVFVLLFTLV